MTKYTISKAFSKSFPFKIWKIVADSDSKLLGIELRNPEGSFPIIYSLDFTGKTYIEQLQLSPKEWTLDAIRKPVAILKKVGEHSPIKEGVRLIDQRGKEVYCSEEYVLLDTAADHIKLRHRSLQSGFERYLDFEHYNLSNLAPASVLTENQVQIPGIFNGELPSYLQTVTVAEQFWLSQWEDKYIWTYHTKENDHYNLNLCIADTSNILYEQSLMRFMPKMIPQPYFQIGNQIFLLSYNKQEIVSYLL